MSDKLLHRLQPDYNLELKELIKILNNQDGPVFQAEMQPHFAIAKQKPPSFLNHKKTIGVAIGGTNTKVLLASMENGRLHVDLVRSFKNPSTDTPIYDFLDEILLSNDQLNGMLRSDSGIGIGWSFPMSVIDGVPFHRTKIPTISGLVGRDRDSTFQEYHFGHLMSRYTASRNLPEIPIFYQGDGIIAHHGAVSLSEIPDNDSSVLVVCGTGLATGDEKNYVQIGLAHVLSDDPLYPMEETEGREIQYAIAGKGLFSLMRRTLLEMISLRPVDFEKFAPQSWFQTADDSRLVVELWDYWIEKSTSSERVASLLISLPTESARTIVCRTAAAIMERASRSLANCVIATMVFMGPAPSGNAHHVFTEGSIAQNPNVQELLSAEVLQRLKSTDIFSESGDAPPLPPRYHFTAQSCIPASHISEADLAQIDLSLIGAVTSMMAEQLT